MFSVYENNLPSYNPDQEISVESIADAPSFADPIPSHSPLSVFGADAIHMMESPNPSSPSASDSNNENLIPQMISPLLPFSTNLSFFS